MATNLLLESPATSWESPDKVFAKTVLSKGYGFNTPQDGSVCKIKVISDVSNILTEVDGDQIKELIVGDVDDPIDKIVEACVRTMKDEEVCDLKFYHPSYHAQIKAKESNLKQLEGKDEKESSVVESPNEEDKIQESYGESGDNPSDYKTDENEVRGDNLENNTLGSPNEVQSIDDIGSASSVILENTICDKIQDSLAIESKEEVNDEKSKESPNCTPVIDVEGSPESHSSETAHTPTMLEVQLQLLSYTREPEIWEMSITEKWRRANYHKQKGMDLYARGAYEWAFRRFGLALKYIISLEHDVPSGHEEGMNITGLKLSCYLNVAACQMRHHNFESVVKNCTKALMLQPNNAKALYRRGSAYLQLQEFDKAKEDLGKAQELEPKNPAIAKQQQLLKAQVQKLNQYYASAMKKMFS